MNLTPEQIAAIQDKVNGMDLSEGLGDERSACSIAAINLALTGKLTDKIPACMSPVIGKWIITIQDRMSAEIRNSQKWKDLLPFAAGTGSEFEAERLALILDWMWSALSSLQPIAEKHNFGKEWQNMIHNKTADAANVAALAALAVDALAARAAANVADANVADADVAYDAYAAAYDAYAAAYYAANAANYNAANYAAHAAANAAIAESEVWSKFNPCDLLEKLIRIENSVKTWESLPEYLEIP